MMLYYLAIGASGADGLADIQELLSALDVPMHVVAMVAFHRPIHRISHLRDVLARKASMPTVIANAGQALDWGKVYIGEPKYHLKLRPSGAAEIVADLSGIAIIRSTCSSPPLP